MTKKAAMSQLGANARIDDVTRGAIAIHDALVGGGLDIPLAKEMSNALGKAIKSVAVRLEYAALRKEKPDIDFLNVPPSKK